MAREFAEKFYHSPEWAACRRAYIAERVAADGGLCEDCREELGEEVHHMIWLSPRNIDDQDITLNHKRLRLLCHVCHTRRHSKPTDRELRYVFDTQGQPIPPLNEDGG